MQKPLIQELLWLSDEQYEYIPKLPAMGTGIFKDKRYPDPYRIWVPGDLKIIPITTDETGERMREKIAEMHDAVRRRHQPHEIRHTREQLTERFGELSEKAQNILFYLGDDPFLPRSKLYEKMGGNNTKIKKEISWLIEHGFIETVKCRTGNSNPPDFFPLTSVGHDWLETPESHRRPQPSHFRHTYYIYRVMLHLQEQGYTTEMEYTPRRTNDGESTYFTTKTKTVYERIDVYAEQKGEKVAYEITLSFSNLEENIYKCLFKMGMDKVIIVCDLDGTKRAKRLIQSYPFLKKPKDLSTMIEVKKITEFL